MDNLTRAILLQREELIDWDYIYSEMTREAQSDFIGGLKNEN
jgi:hypothetical protein